MRRYLYASVAFAALTSCGGSDSVTTQDTAAPTITLTAPNSVVSGGETIVISVAATDNVDPSVTPVLSCSGGTLTGNQLLLANVTTSTTVTCTATATDRAGNRGTGTLTLTVNPNTATLSPASASRTLAAGEVGTLFADNLPLTQESYVGTLGGRELTLVRHQGTSLIFTVPVSMPAGAQTLTVSIAGRTYSSTVTTTAAIAVDNPRAALNALLQNGRATAISRRADASLTASQRTALDESLARIDQATTAVAAMTDGQVSGMASVLAANGLISSGVASLRQVYQPIANDNAACDAVHRELSQRMITLAAMVSWGSALTGVTGSALLAAAGSSGAFPAIVVVGIGAAATLYIASDYISGTVAVFNRTFTACMFEDSVSLEGLATSQGEITTRAIAVAGKQAFTNRVARTVQVRRSFQPQASVRGEIIRIVADATGPLAASPLIPAAAKGLLAQFRASGSDVVPSANIGIAGISRSDISGSVVPVSADAVRLTFSYTGTTAPTQNIDFTFQIIRPGEQPATVSAQLAVALPEADDATVEVVQDTPASSSVQIRNATSAEVVAQPKNGSVTLSANGSFQYTPSSRFFGSDSFTYRARNDQGTSRDATVTINVVRRFEGIWNVTAKATTSSQSSPGLCPSTSESFTINVSKISDVQYSASYSGYDITLTMASKDDPAGPKGSRTVTYDDPPGQTTETVTAQIPDSRRLFGTSFFDYAGPNGSFCKGTVDITGTR